MDESTRLAFAQALELQKRGDIAGAAAAYKELYARVAHPKIAHMLAVALHQQQRSEEALPWFERARERPSTAFHTNYASALLAVGRSRDAETQARLALMEAPEHPGARLNLALSLEAQQQFAAAGRAFAALEAVSPVAAVARRGRIRCLLHTGEIQAARDALGPQQHDEDSETALLRGEIELESGHPDLAETALKAAAEAELTRTRAWLLQARLAQQRADRFAALRFLDRAVALDTEDRAATLQSALVLLESGEVAACLGRLQHWIAAHPRDAEVHSLYLRCAQYEPGFDAAKLFTAHRRWAEMHAGTPELVAPRVRGPDEPLRIGWLSPGFRNGPIQSFFLATLCQLKDLNLAYSVLYNSNPRSEPSSAGFRAGANRWEDIAELDDATLVKRIRDDNIDVLVDLAGHMRGGRLSALSCRVAPVQVTWLDSLGTTGIDAMDFILTDAVSSPPGGESAFTERFLYLPRGRLCYLPPVVADRPDPSARRLISLNRFSKLNDIVIAVWAEILQALPDWTLYVKARAGDDIGVIKRLHDRFMRHGVDPRRIECSGYSTVADALATYRDAAIALDPFPFAGGVNSCDALWMGLPLVTWPWDTLMSRQGSSLLHALDKEQWIARDANDYVAIACKLAADAAERQRWREIAATRVGERLTDARAFATDLISALRRGWQLRASEGFPAVSRRSA